MKKGVSIKSAIVLLMFGLSYSMVLSKPLIDLLGQYVLYILGFLSIFLFCLNRKMYSTQFLFFSVVVLSLIISLMYTQGGIGSAIAFILPFLLLSGLQYISLTSFDEKAIRILSIFMIVFLFIRSFSYDLNWWYDRDTIMNPNTLAQFSVFAYTYFASFFTSKTKLTKVLSLVLLTISAFACINYSSRGALVALITYGLGLILINKINKKKIILCFVILVILSTLFPFLYLYLYENNEVATILGKPLFTGREVIWERLLNKLNDNPTKWFLGLGSNVDIGKDVLNVHNTPFSIIVDFGILGFILYYGYILYLLLKVRHYDVKTKKLILSFFSTTIVLGFTEVTTMWPVSIAMAFCSLGLAIANQNKASKDDLIQVTNNKG